MCVALCPRMCWLGQLIACVEVGLTSLHRHGHTSPCMPHPSMKIATKIIVAAAILDMGAAPGRSLAVGGTLIHAIAPDARWLRSCARTRALACWRRRLVSRESPISAACVGLPTAPAEAASRSFTRQPSY